MSITRRLGFQVSGFGFCWLRPVRYPPLPYGRLEPPSGDCFQSLASISNPGSLFGFATESQRTPRQGNVLSSGFVPKPGATSPVFCICGDLANRYRTNTPPRFLTIRTTSD
jgi:hypothetical protein